MDKGEKWRATAAGAERVLAGVVEEEDEGSRCILANVSYRSNSRKLAYPDAVAYATHSPSDE